MSEKFETAVESKPDQVGCTAMSYQDVNVCVPITVKAFGKVGNAKTQCIGKSVVKSDCDYCPGKEEDVCKFTISQKLRVEVPVIFGARAEADEAFIDCGCAESKDCCAPHGE